MKPLSRRKFLATSGLLSFGIAVSPRPSFAQAGPQLAVRKDVATLAANAPDLVGYRRAVDAMKKLPQTDPRNWVRQAEIHQQFCPHGNWWFLPWHRAYLRYFEQVCRDLLGDSSFALPYWNWTTHPRVPAPLWGLSNPLLDPSRTIDPNTDVPSEFVGARPIQRILQSNALAVLYSGRTNTDDQHDPNRAEGELESVPHDNVHGEVGGDMGRVPTSALDPVFWLHHANIDRLWSSWLRLHGPLYPSDALWANHALKTFYDPVKKKAVDEPTVNTKNEADYGYRYDRYELASGPFARASITRVFGLDSAGLLAGGQFERISSGAIMPVRLSSAVSVPLQASKNFVALIDRATPTAPLGEEPLPEVNLLIEGVHPPGPEVACRVFLNCDNPSMKTPIDDLSYVGTIGFFGDGHGEGSHGHNFIMDARPTLLRLKEAGRYADGKVDVALIPFARRGIGKPPAEQMLKAERVSLVGITGSEKAIK